MFAADADERPIALPLVVQDRIAASRRRSFRARQQHQRAEREGGGAKPRN
jgi:hypothetical protein